MTVSFRKPKSLKDNCAGRQKSHRVAEQSDSLTFSFDRPQDAGSDAVDWALAPSTKDSRERCMKSSHNLKEPLAQQSLLILIASTLTLVLRLMCGATLGTDLKRRVGLGMGLGVRPLLLTRIWRDGEKHCCSKRERKKSSASFSSN